VLKSKQLFTWNINFSGRVLGPATTTSIRMAVVRHKEAIHSGHFMVSEFEAEAQVNKLTCFCIFLSNCPDY
jgi:hypothetical protein